jgi:hypothetical protein
MWPARKKRHPKPAYYSPPFGEADGARTDLGISFVDFDGYSGGLSTGARDFAARILVGRKGSGKTVYLRRLQANASDCDSQYAEEVQSDPPSTDLILRFSSWFDTSQSLLEPWANIWNCAILRAVASHLLCGRLTQHVDAESRQALQNFSTGSAGKLLRPYIAPLSIYSQVAEIIHEHQNRNALTHYISSPYWIDLKSVVTSALRSCPPVFLFLDALDEHFERSPRWWLKCQEGLFQQAVFLQRSNDWNRLHLTVTLRDVVYASMLQSQHASRFAGDSHVRLLTWGKTEIERFLGVKLERLDKRYLAGDPVPHRTVSTWLGVEQVLNPKRGICEPPAQYLMRHTRLLPRDIVIIGNKLCAAISRATHEEEDFDLQDLIRREVHDAASVFGKEQIRICANEIVSSYMPRAAMSSAMDAYVSNDAYTGEVAEVLKKIIRGIGVDRVAASTLDVARAEAKNDLECDLFSAMWRNDLIGFVDGPPSDQRHIFYNHDSLNSYELPAAREYVFHPIVIDATGIASTGSQPVIPYS